MPDRLKPLDVSFLYLEELATPTHVGSVAVFEAPRFDYERLVRLIKERIAFVPRFRQRIRWVPGHLANPVWVDDEHFDITYHVRRSALPRPGTAEQLHELVARIHSRRLDRDRPLWEMYLVEGLEREPKGGERFAILTKTHPAMVDGVSAVDILTVVLDPTSEPRETPPDTWRPAPEPSALELVAGAIADSLRRPTEVVNTIRTGLADLRSLTGRAAGAAGELLRVAGWAARPRRHGPLAADTGEQRRYATVRTDLADYRRIRHAHGGTVNDAILATIAGALRAWLMTRGEPVTRQTVVRAMVPVSVRPPSTAGAVGPWGNGVSSYLVDLPVGEPDPVVRLHQVSYRMKWHMETGRAVPADTLARLSGFAPPTLHMLGARVATSLSRRLFNLVVTNVPGPQTPLYAAGARMLEAYPVVPLVAGQAVSIGLTSYDGGVYYGLNADRDAMPDVGVLAQCLSESLAELLETVR
ncbi:wax ester/triacylglycerol synthase family O-acyltransferase [Carbonactinospora thermoautotrophica]|uniref:WS/DGAT/MGAT family O-acyltransferase n=1 Tax=Carbonactinospora thermoautotrophica TaxID=1469144 RepID=UPI00226FF47E|nr:wax ester/triacylglycerol synthase family O-acyltransferase [Carbonactinospora thermoautotrophica]MCX9190190.1 wax ester/triacylglycerol synthase family O-acyltransferase [Carbonactinospora thermoautotrophica]